MIPKIEHNTEFQKCNTSEIWPEASQNSPSEVQLVFLESPDESRSPRFPSYPKITH